METKPPLLDLSEEAGEYTWTPACNCESQCGCGLVYIKTVPYPTHPPAFPLGTHSHGSWRNPAQNDLADNIKNGYTRLIRRHNTSIMYHLYKGFKIIEAADSEEQEEATIDSKFISEMKKLYYVTKSEQANWEPPHNKQEYKPKRQQNYKRRGKSPAGNGRWQVRSRRGGRQERYIEPESENDNEHEMNFSLPKRIRHEVNKKWQLLKQRLPRLLSTNTS